MKLTNIIQEEVEMDEGSSDTAKMYALMTKAMKVMPGSPKQKEIIKQLNVIRKRMGMPLMKEEAKEETDIHRQYEVGDAFWSPMGKGELFILLSPYTAAKGVKKWTGVEFNFKPNYGDPYLVSADVTTAGDEHAFKGYKKTKITSKMKKQIQKILKDPEELDRIERSNTSVKEIERAIR